MTWIATLLTVALSVGGPTAAAAPDTAFADIDTHYQALRLALLKDSTQGVQTHAESIMKIAATLQAAPTAARADVDGADLDGLKELLPQVVARAKALAAAKDIGAQREALKKLTQPLVRWHEKLTGEKPRLVYCSMERGAWFQPNGEIGNPYGGSRMPRCGSFVGE
jgi:hypothetical protein